MRDVAHSAASPDQAPYAVAEAVFADAKAYLSSREAQQMSESELERELHRRGQESGPMTWRPTMPSDETPPTTLETDLRRLGFNRTADDLNDLVALATRKRWSTTVMLERIVGAELEDRQRRSVERRLTCARLGRFKPLADWDWDWPTAFDRPALERILTLDFLARGENVILVGAQGLGKTMLAKNIAHQAILAGHSALFTTAADLLLDLNGQETARALERRLRHYTRPSLVVCDELGYLAYDARAADLLFQLVSRRYEHRSLLITTNLPFKHWDTVFPNASCAVALIDRLTHHVEILVVEAGAIAGARPSSPSSSANVDVRAATPRQMGTTHPVVVNEPATSVQKTSVSGDRQHLRPPPLDICAAFWYGALGREMPLRWP